MKWHYFKFFANLFNIQLNERHVNSHICFCIVAVCSWSIWRNPSLTEYIVRKGSSILKTFPDICEYPFVHQTKLNKWFLKGKLQWKVWNLINKVFIPCYIKNPLVSCTLDLFYTLAWFYNIMCWSFGKYFFTELYRCSKC